MSEEELKALEAMLAEFSTGAWHLEPGNELRVLAHDPDDPEEPGAPWFVADVLHAIGYRAGGDGESKAVARFIAGSRAAVGRLIAALREARNERDEAGAWCARFARDSEAYEAGRRFGLAQAAEAASRAAEGCPGRSRAAGKLWRLGEEFAALAGVLEAPPHERVRARLQRLEAACREHFAAEAAFGAHADDWFPPPGLDQRCDDSLRALREALDDDA